VEPSQLPLTVGVDIGGTKVLAGVVASDGTVIARSRRETGESAHEISSAIVDAITELSATHQVGAVGLSAAGFISADRTTVLASPNILSWNGVALASEIAGRIGLPVVLENDANCAAWGEVRFGAGRGCDQVLMITVGTGIGGGIVLDGHLVRGGFGIAAEPGHIAVVPNGRPCGCGQQGCWEQYASGSALMRIASQNGARFQSGHEITTAARAGNADALNAFVEISEWLGRGLASIAAILDPRLIIIGGGVSEAADLFLEPTQEAFAQHLPATGQRPHADIVLAEAGADAGMIGAADLARDHLGAQERN
jgi:glucokinase